MFTGALTALITPMKDGRVDAASFEAFVDWQITQGIHGLVPCGTTGESPTLDHQEHANVIRMCVDVTNKRVPVLAGAGSNATHEAIMLAQEAQKAGADGVLSVVPYYNRPSQEGIYCHFKAVHDETDIPIILYNVPTRCGRDIDDETIARLSQLPRVIGIKDATGDLARVGSLRQKVSDDFILLSGEDGTAVAFNALGGTGCISVTSNIAPNAVAQVQRLTLDGDYKKALTLHETLLPLHDAMFCAPSPAPAKYAASQRSLCSAELRLPLVGVTASEKAIIDAALKASGIAA